MVALSELLLHVDINKIVVCSYRFKKLFIFNAISIHQEQFIFISQGKQCTIILLAQDYGSSYVLCSDTICKKFVHFDISQNIAFVQYIDTIILIESGE